jgi:hypothetical protein
LINKILEILEIYAEKIEAKLTGGRDALKIQVLNNQGLISSLQHCQIDELIITEDSRTIYDIS